MPAKKTLSLDEVFEKDLQNQSFQKKGRQIKPYEDLLVDVINRRSDMGLTQKELAKKAKTFQSRISKIESGDHDFRISTIIQIAEALDSELILRLLPFEAKRGDDFSDKVENSLFGKTELVISDLSIEAKVNKAISIDTGNTSQIKISIPAFAESAEV